MNITRPLILATLLGLIASEVFAGPAMQRVDYLSDSIAEKNGNVIRLLGGSTWALSLPTLALVTDDIIIVFQEVVLKDMNTVNVAFAHVDGDEIIAKHVDGAYVTSSGFLTTVIESLGDGAVLRLGEGSLVSIPEYDRYDTGWWPPPYKALLTGNRMYLWNLKKGKRVWVEMK